MKRSAAVIGIVVIALATVAPGAGDDADNAPKTAAAKSALRKYEKSLEKAQQAFAREAGTARKTATAELEVAMKAATRAANLDEANRIKAAIDAMRDDAAGQSGRAPRAVAGLSGSWQTVYVGPENRHVHEFRDDGTVRNTFVGHGEWTAKLERDAAGNTVARYPQFIERYTVAGGRLYVEQFNPARYPDAAPGFVAIGVRDESERQPKRSR